MHYFRSILPALLRTEIRPLLISVLVFGLALLGAFLLVQYRPQLVYSLYGEYQLQELSRAYRPEFIRLNRGALPTFWQDVQFYFFNNSLAGGQLFLGGILLGLGTLALLVYIGVSLGLLMGHLHASGLGATLWPAVVGHSAPELLATVLAGAAGLRLGFWLLACIRSGSLVQAKATLGRMGHLLALSLVLYAIGALLEAGWSHHPGLGSGPRLGLGALIWLLLAGYLAYAWIVARREPS